MLASSEMKKSCYSLANYNFGFFKSEKQAAFLLAQCDEAMLYTCPDTQNGKQCELSIQLDKKGIVSIIRITTGTGHKAVVFTRTVQDQTQADSIKAKRQAAQAAYDKWSKAVSIKEKRSTRMAAKLMDLSRQERKAPEAEKAAAADRAEAFYFLQMKQEKKLMEIIQRLHQEYKQKEL